MQTCKCWEDFVRNVNINRGAYSPGKPVVEATLLPLTDRLREAGIERSRTVQL